MKKSNAVLLGTIVLLAIGGLYWYTGNPFPEEHATHDHSHTEEVHYHTGFSIVVNGELQDYSAQEFMQIVPCTVPDESTPYKEPTRPEDRIHLHNEIGNIAHIHANEVTWQELLQSLRITELAELPLIAIDREGNTLQDPLKEIPKNYDSIVFAFGENVPEKDTLMTYHVSKEDILASEAMVEGCGSAS